MPLMIKCYEDTETILGVMTSACGLLSAWWFSKEPIQFSSKYSRDSNHDV